MAKIRFLHIPKSAGTSFSNCLRRLYGANRFKKNIFIFLGDFERDLENYARLDAVRKANLVLVSGHAPRITGISEIDALPTITFLRDPVERIKSLCQHVSEGKVRNLAPDLDIDAFLADENNIWLENLQTRTLLGVQGYALPDLAEDAIVAQALDVLQNRLACFGITEYFDDSLLLFQRVLGWKNYPVYTRLNQKSRSRVVQFSEAQIRRIRDKNVIDMKLYEAAVALFEARIAACDDIEARRRAFARRQKVFGPLLGVYQLYHKLQNKAQTLAAGHGRKTRA